MSKRDRVELQRMTRPYSAHPDFSWMPSLLRRWWVRVELLLLAALVALCLWTVGGCVLWIAGVIEP
jgi:hypothetical protein